MTKPTGRINPSHVLTDDLRLELAWLAAMGLWSKAALGRTYGVHRKTVQDCMNRHRRTT